MELFAPLQDFLVLLIWSGLVILIAVITRLIWYLTELVKLAHYNLETFSKSIQKFDDLVEWCSTKIETIGVVLKTVVSLNGYISKFFKKKKKGKKKNGK